MFSDNFRRGEGKGKGRRGSKAASMAADLGWKAFQAVNKALPESESITPAWAAEPLLKSYERTAPPLGFPRETDSLCPALTYALSPYHEFGLTVVVAIPPGGAVETNVNVIGSFH